MNKLTYLVITVLMAGCSTDPNVLPQGAGAKPSDSNVAAVGGGNTQLPGGGTAVPGTNYLAKRCTTTGGLTSVQIRQTPTGTASAYEADKLVTLMVLNGAVVKSGTMLQVQVQGLTPTATTAWIDSSQLLDVDEQMRITSDVNKRVCGAAPVAQLPQPLQQPAPVQQPPQNNNNNNGTAQIIAAGLGVVGAILGSNNTGQGSYNVQCPKVFHDWFMTNVGFKCYQANKDAAGKSVRLTNQYAHDDCCGGPSTKPSL